MEPEKFDKKKFDDLFKNINFSFSTVPVNFNYIQKQETVSEMIARLDSVDETVDAMTSYPTAETMLNNIFNKEV